MIDLDELVSKLAAAKNLSAEELSRIRDSVSSKLNSVDTDGISEMHLHVTVADDGVGYNAKYPRQNGSAGSAFDGRIYTDEPIAADPSFRRRSDNEASSEAIRRIAAMRRIANDRTNRYRTQEEIFYLQSKAMEDFEDDYVPSAQYAHESRMRELGTYFSGFQNMSVHALRSYFTWRSKLRSGILERESLSFAFIYSTELMHMIGFDDCRSCYDAFRRFIESYSKLDPRIASFGKKWLNDYAVFYGIEPDASFFGRDGDKDADIRRIASPDEYCDSELFASVCALSGYNVEKSRFFAKYPSDYETIACRVLRAVHRNDKAAYNENYVGSFVKNNYDIFGVALFFGRENHPDCTYEVSELDRFSCENGRWYRERLTRTSKQRMQLGNLMRNTDALSRKRYSMNAQLKTEGLTAELEAVILKEIDAFLTEKRIAEMPKVEFDLSKLEKIRSSADETAGMLLAVSDEAAAETDGGDERDPEIGAEREAPSPCAEEEIESGDTADDPAVSSLNKGERALLECLVRRQDYGPALRSLGMLPSVAADGINEKLMERFGDIVIIDNGAEYEIIDDYLDELKGLLGIK